MGEHFAMGLLMEFFQRQIGALKGFALGAESGVAQTRATLFKSGALAAAAALRPEFRTYDPARPEPPESFVVPPSSKFTQQRPLGN